MPDAEEDSHPELDAARAALGEAREDLMKAKLYSAQVTKESHVIDALTSFVEAAVKFHTGNEECKLVVGPRMDEAVMRASILMVEPSGNLHELGQRYKQIIALFTPIMRDIKNMEGAGLRAEKVALLGMFKDFKETCVRELDIKLGHKKGE
jgi:hypothetical protein